MIFGDVGSRLRSSHPSIAIERPISFFVKSQRLTQANNDMKSSFSREQSLSYDVGKAGQSRLRDIGQHLPFAFPHRKQKEESCAFLVFALDTPGHDSWLPRTEEQSRWTNKDFTQDELVITSKSLSLLHHVKTTSWLSSHTPAPSLVISSPDSIQLFLSSNKLHSHFPGQQAFIYNEHNDVEPS